jgi:hypothetical protein
MQTEPPGQQVLLVAAGKQEDFPLDIRTDLFKLSMS